MSASCADHPALFGRIYRAGELVSSPRRKSPVYYANALGRERMEAFLEAERPDVIACTHLFAAQTLTSMGARRARVTAAVMTDYTCAPFWEEVDMDALYTPSPLLTAAVCRPRRGRVARRAAGHSRPARRACRARTWPARRPPRVMGAQEAHIVLVGGSMGAGNLPQVARELLSLPARVTVVCGSNERVRARIEAGLCGRASPARAGAGAGRCTACWTARDVVVTKPGGLTSTEVMQKRLPLVFVSPIEGVETRNAAFLSGEGAALWAKAPGDAARMAGLLLQDARAREAQRAAQARLVSGTAAMDHRARPDRARKTNAGRRERHDGQGSPVHPAGVSFGRRHVCLSYPAPADGRGRARAGRGPQPGRGERVSPVRAGGGRAVRAAGRAQGDAARLRGGRVRRAEGPAAGGSRRWRRCSGTPSR